MDFIDFQERKSKKKCLPEGRPKEPGKSRQLRRPRWPPLRFRNPESFPVPEEISESEKSGSVGGIG